MPYFQLKRTSDSQFMFNLKGDNHVVVLTSERYATKQGALNGISSVRTNSASDSRYQRYSSVNGHPYFALVAMNGQVLAVSELYSAASSLEQAIEFTKKWGPFGKVVDEA